MVLPDKVDAVTDDSGQYAMLVPGADEDLEISAVSLHEPPATLRFALVEEGPALCVDLSKLKDGESVSFTVSSADERRSEVWNHRPVRQRTIEFTRRIKRVKLVPVPGVVLFLAGQSEANLDLLNDGNSTAKVAVPRLPYGYAFVDPTHAGGFSIAPQERMTVRIRRLTTAAAGDLKFVDSDERSLASVRLYPVPPPLPWTPPGYVVAVDFGTSNTSVFCLETKTSAVVPVPINNDGKERRETVLYAPEGSPRTRWRAFEERGLLPSEILRNLKTLVRENKPGARERLVFYLECMLRNGIEAFLDGRNPNHERSVEFVFTIPVLDGEDGAEYVAYRDTLLGAAREAGFENRDYVWTVRTMLEPDGGALDVISLPEFQRKFSDGERMLVIDVGGGTTDVTLGTVRLTPRTRLQVDGNLALRSGGEQFGGEMATYMLGWRWVKSSDGGQFPDGPDRDAQKEINEQAKVKILVDNGWLAEPARKPEAEKWTTFDDVADLAKPDNWERRFSDLWPIMREAKHKLSDEAARWASEPWKAPPFTFDSKRSPKQDWIVPVELLDIAVQDAANDIGGQIEEFLKGRKISRDEIRHVVMIGGSARLEPLRRKIRELFRGRLVALGPYVDVAVCRGATRLHQNPPLVLPVGFELAIDGIKDPIVLTEPGAPLGKSVRREQPVGVTEGRYLEAKLQCRLATGDALPFLSLNLTKFNGSVWGEVSPSEVRLSAETDSGVEREYRVALG